MHKSFNHVVAFGLCGVALMSARGATTFSGLIDEIGRAEFGATVYVENDMEATCALPVMTAVVLASPVGQTNVITRAPGYTDAFVDFSDAASQLTVLNVVVDWNKAAGTVEHFAKLSAGELTLDAGSEVRNCDIGNEVGGFKLTGTARLVMNDGAVIRGFEGSRYAHGVLIGDNGGTPVFEMNGGVITECVDRNPIGSAAGGQGGVVYVYGGKFIMHGGTITGNTSEHNTAGVVAYSGRWYISGLSFVTNNVGAVANDAWITSGWLTFDGDYLGRMTMRGKYEGMPDSPSQWAAYVGLPDGGMLKGPIAGAGNVSSQRDPNRIINGKSESSSFDFGNRVASVGPGRYDSVSLDDALKHTSNGDVVQIVADVEMENCVIDGSSYGGLTNLTLAGCVDYPVTLKRGTASTMLTVSHAVVRLENLTFDGGGAGISGETLINIGKDGDVTLGPGSVLCNAVTTVKAPAVDMTSEGSHLTMLDGSAIHSCATTDGASYATAIRVGASSGVANIPLFEMKGGVISNCVSSTTKSASSGYGGAVYIAKAKFVMSGGIITNNSALAGGCAGVMAYNSSEVVFTGTACVAGNLGVRRDVFTTGSDTLYMEGEFRGWVGISSGSQAQDGPLFVTCRLGSTGAWNFFSASTDPIGMYRGYNWSSERFSGDDKAYWGVPEGWIDNAGFPSYESFNMSKYLPTAYDLDNPSVQAGFPHVFKGTALALGGTVDLTFDDAEAMKARVPLMLYTAGESAFTGAWTFTVPKATKGSWVVRKVMSGTDVVAYALDWEKPGIMIIVR